MTHDELIQAANDLADALDRRVQIVRVIIDKDGKELTRIVTGSFTAPPDWTPSTAPRKDYYDE